MNKIILDQQDLLACSPACFYCLASRDFFFFLRTTVDLSTLRRLLERILESF